MGSAPRFVLTGPDGQALGEAALSGVSLDGRVRRWFGNPAEYPFSLTVRDASGGTVLTVDKARQGRFRTYFDVAVHLADGQELGRVRQRWPLSGEVTFHGEAEAEIATAPVGRYTAGVEVTPPGAQQSWARVGTDVGTDGTRRYSFAFAPDAPVRIRALTLGYVLARDAHLFPRGRAF